MAEVERRTLLKAGALALVATPFAGYLAGATSGTPVQAADVVTDDPAVVGSWTAPFSLGGVAIHASLTHAGHIHFFGYRPGGSTKSYVSTWSYLDGTLTPAPLPYSRDVFCAGTVVLPDGRVFVAGGHVYDRTAYIGVRQTDTYDPVTRVWTRRPLLSQARWYPTVVGMPNGRALVFGGQLNPSTPSNTVDEYDVAANRITRLPASATRRVGNYPRLHVMPDGRVLNSGPARASAIFNRVSSSWGNSASMLYGVRNRGISVLLPGATRVLTVGGTSRNGQPPTATAEILDLSASTLAWRSTGSLTNARLLANAVVLPDGKVFVIGGGLQPDYAAPIFTPELFDPATETWTQMAPHQASRMYHSTALLLPDGRVFCAGQDDGPWANYAEIWSPPYLFQGARPTFTGAPAMIGYGQEFTISTEQAADIAGVTVIKSGSVTHQVNSDHRSIPLTFTAGTGTLTVTAPANANLAPPGYYLLFVVSSAGVPSEAPFIQVG